jgi:hypothetical protein
MTEKSSSPIDFMSLKGLSLSLILGFGAVWMLVLLVEVI